MDISAFSPANLERLGEDERRRLLKNLGDSLTRRVSAAPDFEREVSAVVGEFKAVGHDLYLYDSDGDFQRWCGDWTKPEGSSKLLLEFHPADGVEVSWSETG